ncbi:S41 family peptidase [Hymenobacter sp. DH14]|uniref:S41 family peptidase n=1 Tax=Hymenobacter cyanobacteriorum TaxID=2926463 RepID=A0A9X1VJT9_9BACT|nr:S41 family peptidase [Hymenobacter cyanobacteriorum]MCI1190122.1 S41 family peptidase [Hymenobacter cyanobacteriorum]
MKNSFLSLALLLAAPAVAQAQAPATALNLDLERVNHQTNSPVGWTSAPRPEYQVAIDSLTRHDGRYALRMQSTTANWDGKAFGVSTLRIPVSFQGKTVKLTGYLKTEKVDKGYAGLWLRVDGEDGMLGLNNMSKENVHGTTDWKAYTISLPLGDQAQTIYVGGLLPGSGTMWLDQLSLTVDDQPLAQAPPKAVKHYKAEQDTAFRHGSGIALDNLSKAQIENLAVLGRVWGFVKYYHPAVARGDYNWDAEMLRILPKVLAAKTTAERNAVLSAWLTGLGPVPACATCREPKADEVRLQADLAWLTDKSQLGPALSQQLTYLRQNRNQDSNYYVRSAPNVGNPLFVHEEVYAQPATPDAGLRLLALYRYWNMIEYFFPYRYAIGEDWQKVLPEFIPQFAAARTDEQYRLAALVIIARIHDTHANVYGSDKILAAYKGTLHAPVQVRFVEGQAVVTDYFHETLGPATGLQKGDVVLAVDGVKVTDLIKARQPLTPASNEPTQLRNMARDLLRGNTDKTTLLIRRAGRDFPVTIGRVPAAQLNLGLNNGTPDPKAPFWKLLPDNVGYLSLGTIRQAELPEAMAKLKNTKGLVIDIRNYPAEFVVFSLTKYLSGKPVPFVRFSEPQPDYPGVFLSTPVTSVPGTQDAPYAGKVVILVNELSQSQSEYTTMALRAVPGAKVVGSTTAGADGNVSTIMLPGNITTMISGIGVYYPDGRETQRVGIVPDVVVQPTIAGIQAGRDEVLERAVQLIEAK